MSKKLKKGRKPIENKKVRVELWVREAYIKEVGDKTKLQRQIYMTLPNNAY